MAVEIISTAGQAHLVRAFYSAFYRDVIWIYLLQSCRRCCGYGKEKSAKRRVFLSLKDLKLRILKIDEVSGAVLNIFLKEYILCWLFVLQDCMRRASCWVGVMKHDDGAFWNAIHSLYSQRGPPQTNSLVILEDHFPNDLWVMFIEVTVDQKSISPCWGTTPSIRFRSSYNLRVTPSFELPISKLRSLGTLPPAAELEMKSWTRKKQWVVWVEGGSL